MKCNEPSNRDGAPHADDRAPAGELNQLPGWDQLRILNQQRGRVCPPALVFPRIQLRGDKAYLRALRAAELTAWESPLIPAAGAPGFEFAAQE